MRKSISLSLLIVLTVTAVTLPASAMSLFGSKAASGATSAAYQSYRGHKTFVMKNPGGWGSPTRDRASTLESMNYSTMVIDRQTKMMQAARSHMAASNAKASAIAKQGIANSVTPLGVNKDNSKKQTERTPRMMPKVPVAEWEKLNQRNAAQQQKSPQ